MPPIYTNMYIYNPYPFKEGGGVPKLQDTIQTFLREVVLLNVGKHIFFLTASYLQDFILVGPLILYGISFIFFFNSQGGRSILSIAFL